MEEQAPQALPAGAILAGQYVIEKVLGQGGFGISYQASDSATGERVAVKEYFPDTMAIRQGTVVVPLSGQNGANYFYGKDRFLEEAQILAQFLGNENIVQIRGYFEENGTAYFVMEFIEGKSFESYIREHGGKITAEDAERILAPVLDALEAVHDQGIIHRDVTPDNIYITTDGRVKLLDFGAARYTVGDAERSFDIVTKNGFAPKEQYARREKQGAYTDIYSLGATYYFALTGQRPPDSLERVEKDTIVAPSGMGAELPAAMERAILGALGVQPEERIQSIAVFRKALRDERAPLPVSQKASAERAAEGRGTVPAAGQSDDQKKKSRRIAAAVAILLVIVVVAAFVLLR